MAARRLLLFVLFAALAAAWFGWRHDGFTTLRDRWQPPPAAPAPVAAGVDGAAAPADAPANRRVGDLQAALLAVRAAEMTRDPESRCLAMPDPPGTAWSREAVAARCALLRKAVMPLPVMREMLVRGRAARLHQVHEERLLAHFEDPAQREQIFASFRQFDGGAEARNVAQAWLRAAPRDPYALTAMAWQRLAEAELAGDAGTPAAAAAVLPLLDRALEGEARLVPACVAAARAARLAGDADRGERALAHCRAIDPEGHHVRLAAAEAAGAAAPADAGAPPTVAALVAASRRRAGDEPLEALLLRSQALRFDPCGWTCHRHERLDLLVGAGRLAWAEAEMVALLASTPDDWALLGRLEAVRRVMSPAPAPGDDTGGGPTSPWFASVAACLDAVAATRSAPEPARACSDALLEARPDDPYAWYVRLRQLEAARRPGSQAALRRMMETVDRLRPEQRALLDRTLAERAVGRG